MILQRDKLFFIGSIIFLFVISWYSYKGYQKELRKESLSLDKTGSALIFKKDVIKTWNQGQGGKT